MQEIVNCYQSYDYWLLTKKPWVTMKLAQTLDAKIAGEGGKRCTLSNQLCSAFTHKMRLHADLILTTAKTIHADDPLLNVRQNGVSIKKKIAIIDTRLSLSGTEKVFTTAEICYVYHDANYPQTNTYPNTQYYPVPTTPNGLLDLAYIIEHLGNLGFYDVFVEAGGSLFSALHKIQLVNRTYIYIVPEILGEAALPAFKGESIFSKKPNISWQEAGDNMIACLDW